MLPCLRADLQARQTCNTFEQIQQKDSRRHEYMYTSMNTCLYAREQIYTGHRHKTGFRADAAANVASIRVRMHACTFILGLTSMCAANMEILEAEQGSRRQLFLAQYQWYHTQSLRSSIPPPDYMARRKSLGGIEGKMADLSACV